MSALDDARAEAYKRYDGDTIIDENTGEPTSFDDWGYAETARRAFVAGVEWLLTAPPTDAQIESALNAWLDLDPELDSYPQAVAWRKRNERYMRAALEAARGA